MNFTWPLMQFSTDVMKNSFSELKLILAKKCHLFGGDKNQGLSHLKGNVNPWIMSVKKWLINVKSCTLIQGGGVTNPAGRDASYHCPPSAFHCIWSRCISNGFEKSSKPEKGSKILPPMTQQGKNACLGGYGLWDDHIRKMSSFWHHLSYLIFKRTLDFPQVLTRRCVGGAGGCHVQISRQPTRQP